MVEDWTKPQEDEITKLYGRLKGNYQKLADKELFGGPQLPYETAKGILEKLIDEQKRSEGGLEAKTGAAHAERGKKSSGLFGLGSLTRPQAALGLAAIVLMLAMIAAGPVGATAGYKAATAYAAMPVY